MATSTKSKSRAKPRTEPKDRMAIPVVDPTSVVGVQKTSVYYAPLIINGHQLPTDIGYKKRNVTIDVYWTQYLLGEHVDKRPPYQRDSCWTRKQKVAFIQSCFNEKMAIPPFYLCEKKGRKPSHEYSIIDSQQRTIAITEFMRNEFPITVMELRPTRKGVKKVRRRFFWEDFEHNPELFGLREEFLRRNIELVIFETMDDDEQRKLFLGLNNGSPLNPDEISYCPNYLSRAVLAQAFEKVFRSTNVSENFMDDDAEYGPGLAAFLQSSTRDQRRFRHLRTMHEVLILCTGVQGLKSDGSKYVIDKPAPRSCKKTDRQRSAFAIHELLKQHEFEYDEIRADEILGGKEVEQAYELLSLSDVLDRLVLIADLLTDIFWRNTALGRSRNKTTGELSNFIYPRNAIDPLCFLYAIVESGDTTLAKLNRNKGKLVEWLDNYYPAKLTLDYDAATSDALTMAAKYSLMRQIFNLVFDTEIEAWPIEKHLEKGGPQAVALAISKHMDELKKKYKGK